MPVEIVHSPKWGNRDLNYIYYANYVASWNWSKKRSAREFLGIFLGDFCCCAHWCLPEMVTVLMWKKPFPFHAPVGEQRTRTTSLIHIEMRKRHKSCRNIGREYHPKLYTRLRFVRRKIKGEIVLLGCWMSFFVGYFSTRVAAHKRIRYTQHKHTNSGAMVLMNAIAIGLHVLHVHVCDYVYEK